MEKPINKDILSKALSLLGMLLEQNTEQPITLIICGGSALINQNLVARTTKDVDIVAQMDSNGNLQSAGILPATLLKAAQQVAIEMNLPRDWLNNGPHSIINPKLPFDGLPKNLLERTLRQTYGKNLIVLTISRLDQIHFKLYAAADKGGPSYHLDDLFSMHPTDEEIVLAAKWAKLQDPSEEFASTIEKMLTVIGFKHVLDRI